MHRVFIAINLPEDIKEELVKIQERYFELPCRWTKKENLHITLEFIGNISNEELKRIFEDVQHRMLNIPAFEVELDKISYFPDGNLPKYIFATGEKYHITLARISQWGWRKINPEDRPDVSEKINLKFKVNSVEVMESFLKKGGSEYRVLKSFKLC